VGLEGIFGKIETLEDALQPANLLRRTFIPLGHAYQAMVVINLREGSEKALKTSQKAAFYGTTAAVEIAKLSVYLGIASKIFSETYINQ
jgi:hypothetical protein